MKLLSFFSRVTVNTKAQHLLDFVPTQASQKANYKLYFICDSYLGADQEFGKKILFQYLIFFPSQISQSASTMHRLQAVQAIKKDDLINKILARSADGRSQQRMLQDL